MLGPKGTKGGLGEEGIFFNRRDNKQKCSYPDVVVHTCHFLHRGCGGRRIKEVVDRLHYTRPYKQARFWKETINVTFSKMKSKFNISWLKST